MSTITDFIRDHALDRMRIAGRKVGGPRSFDVFNPYTAERSGSVP